MARDFAVVGRRWSFIGCAVRTSKTGAPSSVSAQTAKLIAWSSLRVGELMQIKSAKIGPKRALLALRRNYLFLLRFKLALHIARAHGRVALLLARCNSSVLFPRFDLASRSSLQTTSVSPSPNAAIAFANCGRSLCAPLIFSANILAQPTPCNASVCACKVWPSVLTLAYPIVAIRNSVLCMTYVKKKSAIGADFCFAQMLRFPFRVDWRRYRLSNDL